MATPQTQSRWSAHTTAWLLMLALLACLTLPMLTRRGMFIDGIFFAAVSRNLAAGIGDTWHLQYSETFMRQFREHPRRWASCLSRGGFACWATTFGSRDFTRSAWPSFPAVSSFCCGGS